MRTPVESSERSLAKTKEQRCTNRQFVVHIASCPCRTSEVVRHAAEATTHPGGWLWNDLAGCRDARAIRRHPEVTCCALAASRKWG